MAPGRQKRRERVHLSPLEKKTPKHLYKLSKLFYYKKKRQRIMSSNIPMILATEDTVKDLIGNLKPTNKKHHKPKMKGL